MIKPQSKPGDVTQQWLCLPRMCSALGSIARTEENEMKQQKD